MSSHVRTYIPAPNWDIPADSDLVVLGRLIHNPKNPESKVTGSSHVPIPPPKIYEGEKTYWQVHLDQMRAGKIGLWAKCMQFVGGGLSFSQVKASLEDHKFDTLETKYFVPDEDYLTLALQDSGVQTFFQTRNWREPVYLITGIKTARGASVSTESSTERSTQAEVKVDATSVGAPVEVGPEGSWDSKKTRGVSYGGSTDYIFAYQLTRMKPKKGGKTSKNQGFVKGAVYERGEGDDEEEVKLSARDVFDVEEEDGLGFPDTWEEGNEEGEEVGSKTRDP